ncbi:MAG: lipoic acid synthetase [Nitrospirae bacterium]|nr:MAG: lipoic acid synthetase [Nitrospirota bacterium]
MRLPDWIKQETRRSRSEQDRFGRAARSVHSRRLHTVCEEARCPNQSSCFARPTAAFLILGDACTRNCGFCSVQHREPQAPDMREPESVAEAAAEMQLRYVVITSVTRDDLPDGGASHFAATICAVRQRLPEARIEVLVPDFRGQEGALHIVLDALPDVLNHNTETVPRLYPAVRPQAEYERSLVLLRRAKDRCPDVRTKSGLMVGMGEQYSEVLSVLRDLRAAGCDSVTIGQYLRPTKKHLPVVEYISPDVFEQLRSEALGIGFLSVSSAPLARSSMNAEELFRNAEYRSRNSEGAQQETDNPVFLMQ